jgi:hypothetical protein
MKRVFISHAKDDAWFANHIAADVRCCGASTFLDETDVTPGDEFKKIILSEIARCDDLIVLLTPWSAGRSWVWVEVGAAWGPRQAHRRGAIWINHIRRRKSERRPSYSRGHSRATIK